MKRLITYVPVVAEDGTKKGIIQTISEPIDTESVSFKIDDSMIDNSAFIDADIPKPAQIEGKKAILLYNFEVSVVEVIYEDIEDEELTGGQLLEFLREQNKQLRKENKELRDELDLTQAALFELDQKVNGGADNE